MNQELRQSLKKLERRSLTVSILLLLAGCLLSMVWQFTIKEELANQSINFIRRGIQTDDPREVIHTISGIRFDGFDAVIFYGKRNEKILALPASVDPGLLDQHSFPNFLKFSYLNLPIYFDNTGENYLGMVSFVFSKFSLAGHAFLVWLLALVGFVPIYRSSRSKLIEEFDRQLQIKEELYQADLARKIRHNIRSPLAVLKDIIRSKVDSSNTAGIQGQRALNRIEEILSELKNNSKQSLQKMALTLAKVSIKPIITEIIQEKGAQLVGSDIKLSCNDPTEPMYTNLPASELRATLSNLIDNAIHAVGTSGTITVNAEFDNHLISLSVIDNGHGIPNEILPRVFEKNFTYGKEDGTGLGLYYAKKLMDENSGSIDIKTGKSGSTVSLMFPRQSTPSWHTETLGLTCQEEIVIIDDQDYILALWKQRLSNNSQRRLMVFNCSETFLRWYKTAAYQTRRLFLIDYDLGIESQNGLELISSLKIAPYSILVTGHFDDPALQDNCTEIGCRLLPKDQISLIPIT